MSEARFLYDNLVPAATVSATTAQADRPASYVQHLGRWRSWVSTATAADQHIVADFGAPVTFGAVGLVDATQHTGGSIVFEHSPDNVTYTPAGTFPAPTSRTGVTALWLGTPVARRYARVRWVNTATVVEAVRCGIIAIGPVLQLSRDVFHDASRRRVDPSLISQSIGRQEYAHLRQKYFSIDGRFPALPVADDESYAVMFDAVGSAIPFVFGYDPSDIGQTYWARFNTAHDATHMLGTYWDTPFQVQEVL